MQKVSKISDAKSFFSHSATWRETGRHSAFLDGLMSLKEEGKTVSFLCMYLSSCVKGTPLGVGKCPWDFPLIVNRGNLEGARDRGRPRLPLVGHIVISTGGERVSC